MKRRTSTLLALLVICFGLFFSQTSQAGGLDPNHHWMVQIGDHDYGAAEYSYPDIKGGKPFTRVRIRNHGRDFPCRIETLAGCLALVPVLLIIGAFSIRGAFQRRAKLSDIEQV